ncbi:MAG TPA: hypothetical protein VGO04_06360 [Ensifer sp.]|jgi:hypothetical protein|uniref:hypothetical protein n=1 Tax=Ensifer sp. TaxID=1872086 RepID=UPI002E1413D8|nr:hypothetical protein [Ensifer sp.]
MQQREESAAGQERQHRGMARGGTERGAGRNSMITLLVFVIPNNCALRTIHLSESRKYLGGRQIARTGAEIPNFAIDDRVSIRAKFVATLDAHYFIGIITKKAIGHGCANSL